jgi:putative membrane protein
MVVMNPQRRRIPLPVLGAVIAASLCSFLLAQPVPTPTLTPSQLPGENSGGMSHHDRVFLRKASGAGMREIDISRAVMDHLVNAQAKELAQMMITDHTAADEELMTLAANKEVKLPPEDVTVTDEWSKKTGDVDSAYAKEMVSDHLGAVKLFEEAAKSGDPDIAAFAQKTLPTLQHHLMMAQDLAKTVN